MKKQSILLILFILNMAMTFAQKAYRGTSSYASDIVCNVEKGKVYRGQSRYTSDIIARFDGTNLYRGNSTYSSDIIMTWRDGKIYRGRSSYQSDVLATWRSPHHTIHIALQFIICKRKEREFLNFSLNVTILPSQNH